MGQLSVCAVISSLFLGIASGDAVIQSPAGVTVILEFEAPPSSKSLNEMKREVELIMKDSGLRFDWRLRSEVTQSDSFPDLVLVKFKGNCVMEPQPFLYDERGPLAWTHTSEATVLPFSEVKCNKVRTSLSSAIRGDDHNRADLLLGRALGRVLAHELCHVLGQTTGHARTGVARISLSAAQLISDGLRLSTEDIQRLQNRARRQ